MKARTGRVFCGDFELIEEIARGGMGIVYKARQVSLNRTVALKMILAGQFAGSEDVARFHAEAESAANLDHPGIVPVYAAGKLAGQHYFSMGYVDGQSLASRLRSGPVPVREAAELMAALAEAIEYAHDRGVIHRDLKPANVMLDKDGLPHITDFGLAKRVEAECRLTATGQLLGTPSYMSPEQAAGKTNRIGPLSDVYSLGAILYELLTNRPPFQAPSPIDTLMQVLDDQPTPPRAVNSDIPRDLDVICMKCLEKDPAHRYASAGELAADLKRYLAGELIHASSVNILGRASRALTLSQHEDHFHGWGLAVMIIGAIVFGAHAVIYVLATMGFPDITAYWIPRGVMFALILALLFYVRPGSMLPRDSAERPIWAVWIGYLIAVSVTNLTLYLRGEPRSALFAYSAILSGFGFFIIGSHMWGGGYAVGMMFFATAPLLAMYPDSSAFWFGTLWGIALLCFGLRYWKHGAQQPVQEVGTASDPPER